MISARYDPAGVWKKGEGQDKCGYDVGTRFEAVQSSFIPSIRDHYRSGMGPCGICCSCFFRWRLVSAHALFTE